MSVTVLTADLEVAVDNTHVMEVFDSIQNLPDELTGIFLCIEAFLDDAIKQLTARHPGQRGRDSVIRSDAGKNYTQEGKT